MKTAAPIRMNDFQRQWSASGELLHKCLERVGASGWYVLGSEVDGFERELADFWGREHAIGVASGLDSLEIGLRALGLRAGEKVLTTPLSAFATTLAIVRAGGVPVFADVDASGLLDLDRARTFFSENPGVRFLVPVHLYGFCLDMEALESLREDFGLLVVEDCAQSIGSSFNGRNCGTVGQVTATSFYPTKNLGAIGDGGALLCDDKAVMESARRLRDYGQNIKFRHAELGMNSRLDELQAAFLRTAFLPQLNQWTARRKAIAREYIEGIDSRHLTVPPRSEGSDPVFHLFPVLAEEGDREAFMEFMAGRGIQTGIHYPVAIPDQEAMSGVTGSAVEDGLHWTRVYCSQETSLPIHPFLEDDEVQRVISACNDWTPR